MSNLLGPETGCVREGFSRSTHVFSRSSVKEAHRQIPIDPRDWHMFGCQLERGADVFINTVGTLGITSASYYWSRVASAIGRLTQYLAADRAETWQMVVSSPLFFSLLPSFFLFLRHEAPGLGAECVASGERALRCSRQQKSSMVSKVGRKDVSKCTCFDKWSCTRQSVQDKWTSFFFPSLFFLFFLFFLLLPSFSFLRLRHEPPGYGAESATDMAPDDRMTKTSCQIN